MKKQHLLALSALSLLASASIPSVHAEGDYIYRLRTDGFIYDSITNEKYYPPQLSKIDGIGGGDGWNYRMFNFVKRQCVEHLPFASDEENTKLAELFADLRSHNIQFDERNCPIPDNEYLVNDNNPSNVYTDIQGRFLRRDIEVIKWKYKPCEGADLMVFMNTVMEFTEYKRNHFPADLKAYPILKARANKTGDDPKQHAVAFLKSWDKTKKKVSGLNDIFNDWLKEVVIIADKMKKARYNQSALAAAKAEMEDLGRQWSLVRDELGYSLTKSPFGLEDGCRFDLEEGDDELLQDEPLQ